MAERRYYVGMTGLTPEQRLRIIKTGIKEAARVREVRRAFGAEDAHLNPMSYENGVKMEMLAESLRNAAISCTADTERVRY